MKKIFTLFAFITLLISIVCTSKAQTILYVNTNAIGVNNGNSWTDAYTKLSDALQFTIVNPSIQYEIRVASGTYYPTGTQNGTNRDSTFLIRQVGGIKLLGGYDAATDIRNIEANTTILSGDIGAVGNIFDNSYHVMVIANLAQSADSVVVDGFTISDGIANGDFTKTYNGQVVLRNAGGGINLTNNASGSKTSIRNCILTGEAERGGGVYNGSSSPHILNCSFTACLGIFGGGIYNIVSFPIITECNFSDNRAVQNGGGMYNERSSPQITECNFTGNRCPIGGGIYNNLSSPIISKCNISGNRAFDGGIGGGGIFNVAFSEPVILNSIITGNIASDGAGVINISSSPRFINSIISGNNSILYGNVIRNMQSSAPSFINCIIHGNSVNILNETGSNPTISFSNIEGGYVGTGNINQDPLFVDAPNFTTAPFTGGDYRPQANSPSINQGNNAGYSGNINSDTDLDDNPRLFCTSIDMGAYEYQQNQDPPIIICPTITQTVYLGADCSANLPDYTLFANANSICGVQSVTQFPVPGSIVFSEGSITVTLTVTSNNGLTSQCGFLVFVQDIIFPTITCPSNQTVTLGQNCTGQLMDYRSLTQVSDNCNIQNVFQGPSPFTTVSGAGFVNVTMTVIDVNGNLSQCNFTVTKVDNIPPTIICPSTQTLTLSENCAATLPNYTGLAITGDNCGVQNVTQMPAPGSIVTSAGNTTVTLTVRDVNGLTSTCSLIVTKVDNSPPSISCPPAQTLILDPECMAILPDYTSLATTGDNCGVQNISQIPAAGTIVSATGDISFTLAVTDVNGLTNSCSFTVTKADNSPPSVECFNQTIIFNGENSISLAENDLSDADDNCGIQSISISPNSISSVQVGQTVPVLVTVTDINSNLSSCISLISVSGLPPGWSQNINGVGCASGNEIDYNPSTEVWTATSTNCYYSSPFTSDGTAFAQRTLCGDGSITAQVTGISGTSLGWAGVIMRESNAAGAKKAQLTTNMAGNQSRREFRVSTNGSAIPQNFAAQNRYWLRLVRSGNQFVMYNSHNGVQWYQVGNQNIVMGSCIEIGPVATNYTSNSTLTATFANVSYTGSGPLMQSSIAENNNSAATANIQPDLSIYPNPSSGELNLDLMDYIGKDVQIELYSMEGKPMQFLQYDEILQNTHTILLDGYSGGMYFLKLKSKGLPDVTKMIVLQK